MAAAQVCKSADHRQLACALWLKLSGRMVSQPLAIVECLAVGTTWGGRAGA
jgi:hypothetical protein